MTSSHRQEIETLADFVTPGSVEFGEHDGLVYVEIDNASCRAKFYLLGAHVAEFQPRSSEHPLLFMSDAAAFQEGKAIRGGVPICFPWFGANSLDPNAPAHGLVRQKIWELKKVEHETGATQVTLATDTEHFHLTYHVTFADKLTTALTVRNTTDTSQRFEVALHSYFQVADAREVLVRGLENVVFLDQLTGANIPPTGEPIRFVEETDRIYLQTEDAIEIEDPGFGRTIRIEKQGSRSTVVWNPWIAKAERMPDFGDHEWPSMCCIETANIGADAVTLEPDECHTTSVTVH